MFDGTMVSEGRPAYQHRLRLRDGADGRRRLLRRFIIFILFSVLALSGCRSTTAVLPRPEAYRSGVNHYDIAFLLVQDAPLPDRMTIYTTAAAQFTAAERIDRAEATLRSLELHIAAESADSPGDGADLVVAWHRLAAVDENVATDARRVTNVLLDRVGGVSGNQDTLMTVLAAQLNNPNLAEDSLRRTIDELYLIDNDSTRAAGLVDAATLINTQGDLRTLNPVVQQAIAVVPIVDSALMQANLAARLAALSSALGRTGDVESLIAQARRYAEQGLVVDDASFYRIVQIIESMNEIARVNPVGLTQDPLASVDAILVNVTPQSIRARAYGVLAVTSPEWSADDALRQLSGVADPFMRARYTAEFIRDRALADPSWQPSTAIAELLGSLSLSGAEQAVRAEILTRMTSALLVAGQSQEIDRLRGLFSSVDEYNRIYLGSAEYLISVDLVREARAAVDTMSGIPEPGMRDSTLPRFRLARVWRDLGEYDEALSVAEGLPSTEAARLLTMLPADFIPNPISAASLQRIERSSP